MTDDAKMTQAEADAAITLLLSNIERSLSEHDWRLGFMALLQATGRLLNEQPAEERLGYVMDAMMILGGLTGCEIDTGDTKVSVVDGDGNEVKPN